MYPNTAEGNQSSSDFIFLCFYLAFDEREAMARGWGSGRTRALWGPLIGLGRGGGGLSVEGVLLAAPLKRRKLHKCDCFFLER